MSQFNHVLQPVNHPCVRGFAIPASATCLLIIGFNRFGHIHVCDEAHIRFVYPHAKGDGGNDDNAIFAQETRLVVSSSVRG